MSATKDLLYAKTFGVCSFCGRAETVVSSNAGDPWAPPDICRYCAHRAVELLGET